MGYVPPKEALETYGFTWEEMWLDSIDQIMAGKMKRPPWHKRLKPVRTIRGMIALWKVTWRQVVTWGNSRPISDPIFRRDMLDAIQIYEGWR